MSTATSPALTGKVMLVCPHCSMRLRELDPADIPAQGIVCRCSNRLHPAASRPDPGRRRPAPVEGPGKELALLLRSLGISEPPGCDCQSRMARMNRWGSAGCRERLPEIRTWLQQAYAATPWPTRLRASTAAIASGLALQLDPSDVLGSLVAIAITRAEQQGL
jgi:hypothetical protein